MFQTKVIEKIKAHIFCAITFFPQKSPCLSVNVEKYCRTSQAIYDNMTHVPCMLDT